MDYQNYTREELIKEIDKLKEENKKLKNLLDLHGISIKDNDNEFQNFNKDEKVDIYFTYFQGNPDCVAEEYFNKIIPQLYNKMLIKEDINENAIILNQKEWNKQEKVIKSKIILYTISRLINTTKGIEKIHIEDIINLCEKNIGNKFLTPNKHLKIMLKKGQIYFLKL